MTALICLIILCAFVWAMCKLIDRQLEKEFQEELKILLHDFREDQKQRCARFENLSSMSGTMAHIIKANATYLRKKKENENGNDKV